MLSILPQTSGNLLVVSADEKLTTKDYEETFIPALESIIAAHAKINAVLVFEPSFSGWEMGAVWEDAKFGVKHRTDFNRIAVVGAPQWVSWATRVGELFIHGEAASFEAGQFDAAVAGCGT